MNLESCRTLHAWKIDSNKYVICAIQIEKRAKKYFSGQQEPHFTHHWLQPEHWVEFESKLNELAASGSFKCLGTTTKHKLSDSIQLSISKTSIPIDSLCDTFMPDIDIRKKDVIAAIDCKFEYLVQEEYPEELSPFKDLHCDNKVEKRENQRKIPRIIEPNRNIEVENNIVNFRRNYRGKDDTDKNVRRKESTEINEENLQFEQDPIEYLSTPRKEIQEENAISSVENPQLDLDPIDYLGTLLKDSPSHMLAVPGEEEKSQDFVTPQKVRLHSSSDGSHKKQAAGRKEQHQKNSSNTSKACPKRYKRDENGSTSREREVSKKRKKYKKIAPASSESSDDSHEKNNSKKALKVLNGNSKDLNECTISNGKNSLENSAKKIAIATVPLQKPNGTVFTEPKSISFSPAITSKRKQKKKTNSKSSESRSINTWLSKTNKEKTKEKTKKNDPGKKCTEMNLFSSDSELERIPNSDSQSSSQEMKKLEDRKEYNREVTKLLKELIPKTPKKIKNLDLMQLKNDEILSTFDTYKSELESLFHEFKSKSKPKHKNGVDHFLVMALLSDSTQLEMMNALSERYEKHREGLPKYGELFSMVLMPEWILCIFMERHGMTREEAIEHIKAQNAYKVYSQSEVQIDESIMLES